MNPFSPAARLMARPFRVYAEIGREDDPASPTIAGGVMNLLVVLGAFVAVTATGRFAPRELAEGALSFAYIPVVQAIAITLALRATAKGVPVRRAIALYLAGHGPWFALLVVLSGGCLFAPEPATLLLSIAPPLFLGTFVWGAVLTYACFRSGLRLERRHAVASTLLFYLVLVALVLAYYTAAGQLLPILPW
jgi:hypothetical protein